MARNEIHETEDQLVARYIGGLRVQIQETVNLFDPISVSAAHQRALLIEKQLGRRSSGGLLNNTGGNTEGVDHVTSSSGPSQHTSGGSSGQRAFPNVPQASRVTSSSVKCFGCGETDHRQADCKKHGKKTLFVDPEEYEEEDAYVGEEPVFDDVGKEDVEVLEGDVGPALVVRRTCLTPRANDDKWQRNNIFQSTCTISWKVCQFVIDAGSCENIVSIEVV